jgi:Activator of Hsp90 ATPase homolog 1-like protein
MNDEDETMLRLERLIPVPPEVLFALFVEPAQLLRWWAPDGCEPSIDALDIRPGGRWRTLLRRRMAAAPRPAASTGSSSRRAVSPSPGPGRTKAARAATRPRSW